MTRRFPLCDSAWVAMIPLTIPRGKGGSIGTSFVISFLPLALLFRPTRVLPTHSSRPCPSSLLPQARAAEGYNHTNLPSPSGGGIVSIVILRFFVANYHIAEMPLAFRRYSIGFSAIFHWPFGETPLAFRRDVRTTNGTADKT